jgi:hypothetical protein
MSTQATVPLAEASKERRRSTEPCGAGGAGPRRSPWSHHYSHRPGLYNTSDIRFSHR